MSGPESELQKRLKGIQWQNGNCLSCIWFATKDPLNADLLDPAKLLILSFVPIFLGLGFLYIVLGAWLVTVGFTAVQAGLLISAQGIAVVLTSIPLGIISDIYGRKQLLILGNLAGAGVLLVFAL